MKYNFFTLLRIIPFVLFGFASPLLSAASSKATYSFHALGVAGSFVVNIHPKTGELQRIASVSLSIEGHAYRTQEVRLLYDDVEDVYYIGGRVSGANTIRPATTDFFLAWRPAAGDVQQGYFVYLSDGVLETESDFTEILITPGK